MDRYHADSSILRRSRPHNLDDSAIIVLTLRAHHLREECGLCVCLDLGHGMHRWQQPHRRAHGWVRPDHQPSPPLTLTHGIVEVARQRLSSAHLVVAKLFRDRHVERVEPQRINQRLQRLREFLRVTTKLYSNIGFSEASRPFFRRAKAVSRNCVPVARDAQAT
jgi:hypothetical protein